MRPWHDLGKTIPRRGNRLLSWVARGLMRLCGWRMTGSLPDLPKMVMTAAPHTSNWDFLVGVGAMYAAGFQVSFLGKHTLFRPPLGWVMKWLGGKPVDRASTRGMVAETVAQIEKSDQFILALAPEGTRKRVTEWRTGFWRVAKDAKLPIVLGFFDYGTRTVGFGPTIWPNELERDLREIQQFYRTKTARRPELFGTPAGLCLLLLLGATSLAAQRPLNLDFEKPSVAGDLPWGWTFGWSAFGHRPAGSVGLDSTIRHRGQRSLRISLPDSADGNGQTLTLMLPAGFALGREVTVSGWIRAEGLRGKASLALEAWKDQAIGAADTAAVADPARPGWQRHELTIRVPQAEIHSIVVTAGLQGSGSIWFDDLELTVNGKPIAALPNEASPPTAAELAWLGKVATPLQTVDPAAPDRSDLTRFRQLVGNARVVGLGESTHGTSEFFRVKHRLLRYLVEQAGFNLFAIEANQLAVERINRYVQLGESTAEQVIRTMFAVWNTQEMLSLLKWVRDHNVRHPNGVVRFAGYDMQDHGTPVDTLRAFLQRREPARIARLDQLTRDYRSQPNYATPRIADSIRARWHRQADTLWREISASREPWLRGAATGSDSGAVEWAVQSANLYRQAARLNQTLNSPDRDSLMAANLDWVLGAVAPGARAVVWAHDVHVSRGGDPKLSFNGGAQMGAYLSRWYGKDYRALSLLTYGGRYSATQSFIDHRMISAEAFPAPSGSFEEALHRLKGPAASVGWIVDLRGASEAGGKWLELPRPIRHIGYAAYDYGFELRAVLPLEFDGVVFIDRTEASRRLP